MQTTEPIRITRAGSLGRAAFAVGGCQVTVVSTQPGTIGRAALLVRRGLTPMDLAGGPHRARGADRLALRAARAARAGVLVSLDGDLATAGAAPAGGWPVRLTDGSVPEPLSVRLDAGGLATVRAAEPTNPWRIVTVAARSCRLARATALAALSRGEDAVDWVSSLGLSARMVDAHGAVQIAGWRRSPQVAA
ncbi:MAG: hypothetical protein KGQ66_04215 [Acidobacteriota bacterium]|nr:hypothetical protein [Acidobacteriota bacterium]